MYYLKEVLLIAIGCLQTSDSDDARNAAGGQEGIFLHRNQ